SSAFHAVSAASMRGRAAFCHRLPSVYGSTLRAASRLFPAVSASPTMRHRGVYSRALPAFSRSRHNQIQTCPIAQA
ncbi:hypothetical protein, partial [Burkholderia cenocepacia]